MSAGVSARVFLAKELEITKPEGKESPTISDQIEHREIQLMASVNWSDAYDNGKAVGGSEPFVEAWAKSAAHFWDSIAPERLIADQPYNETTGHTERQRYDLFMPSVKPVGLMIFVHGGYWMRLDPSFFSHLANGPNDRGWAVAIPGYDLCPDVSIAEIATQIAQAVTTIANRPEFTDKPLVLTGHSAGGHLVTRIVSSTDPETNGKTNASNNLRLLPVEINERIRHVVSISGIHDLRPLMNTAMNDTLGITPVLARTESPALLTPASIKAVTCWVGDDELPEFKRQSALLSGIWHALGPTTRVIAEPSKNHFTVIDNLQNKSSPIVDCILSD